MGKLSREMGVRGSIARNSSLCPQHIRQLGKCGPDVAWDTPGRIGAVATWQMLRHESFNGSFADRSQGVVLGCQPMGEVRDAANVNAPSVRGIPTAMQVVAVGGDITLKNAVLQPGTLLRLDDDLFGHPDLLSGGKVQAGDQDYAQDEPYRMRRSA